MTTTEIKLTPAMTTALKLAEKIGDNVYLPDGTKAQTIKGLVSRGLSNELGVLTPEGAEASFQLGADVSIESVQVQEEPLADWERELLGTPESIATPIADEDAKPQPPQDKLTKELVKMLDTPTPVQNRADRRFAKFSLRGMMARRQERKRVKEIKKYGTPNKVAA